MDHLFPDFYADGLEDRVNKFWDLSKALPLMRQLPDCCGPVVYKDWKFHSRARVGSRNPWRCDVRTKCLGCSQVRIYGVVVPAEMVRDKGQWIHWRTAKKLLSG